MRGEGKKPHPFFYQGDNKAIGILLIHGFTGSTAEMHPMGLHLWQQGYTVHAPLLKGHGTTPEEMQATTWVDWLSSALAGYQRLLDAGCQQIIPIGHSMGGLLALKVAQHRPVLGLATLCAPIQVKDKRIGLARYVQHVVPYLDRRTAKATHIEQELFPYDKTPVASVHSLYNLLQNTLLILPLLKQPILIVQAERDETVDPCSGQLLFEQIGSNDKELVYFKESSHIITLDKEKEVLFKQLTCFIHKLERMIDKDT